MHRQRPTPTQRSHKPRKKGYKLKTLTPEEARLRTVKAWKTKHSKYRYGAPLAIAADDEGRDPKQIARDKYLADHAGGHHVAKGSLRAHARQSAREIAQEQAFMDTEFVNWMRSRSPAEQREIAGLMGGTVAPEGQTSEHATKFIRGLSSATPEGGGPSEREVFTRLLAGGTDQGTITDRLAQLPPKQRTEAAVLLHRYTKTLQLADKGPAGEDTYLQDERKVTLDEKKVKDGVPVRSAHTVPLASPGNSVRVTLANAAQRAAAGEPTKSRHDLRFSADRAAHSKEIAQGLMASPAIQAALIEAPAHKKPKSDRVAGDPLTTMDIRRRVLDYAHALTRKKAGLPSDDPRSIMQDLARSIDDRHVQIEDQKGFEQAAKKIDKAAAKRTFATGTEFPYIRDRRLMTLTAEEKYRSSGHEETKGLIAGWKAQAGFIKEQQGNRARAARLGLLEGGWSPGQGRVNPDRGILGFGPNLKWRYTLNQKHPDTGDIMKHPKIKEVRWGDTTTEFHRGARHANDETLKDGEWEEIRGIDLRRKFQGTFGSDMAEVHLPQHMVDHIDKTHRTTDPGLIAKRRFVVLPELTEVKTKDIRLHEVRGKAVTPSGRMINLPARERIYFIPPALAESAGTHEIALRIPGIGKRIKPVRHQRKAEMTVTHNNKGHKIVAPYGGPTQVFDERGAPKFRTARGKGGHRGSVVNERLVWARVHENQTGEIPIPGLGVGVDIPIGKMVAAGARTNPLAEQRRLSRIAAMGSEKPAKGVFSDATWDQGDREARVGTQEYRDSHLKTLAAAAGASTLYTAHRRFKRVGLPKTANRIINTASDKYPKLANLRKKYRVPTNPVPIKEAMRPLGESMIDWKHNLTHPLSSPEGTAFGVNFGKWYYGENWMTDVTHSQRHMKQTRLSLERVLRVREQLVKDIYSENPIKRRLAKHSQNVMKAPDYVNFDDALKKATEEAHNVIASHPGTKAAKEAERLLKSIDKGKAGLTAAEVANALRSSKTKGTDVVPYVQAKNHNTRNFLLTSGAVAGSALGAHYLYHRHTEGKKAPEDRTAYYNKLLPKPFTVYDVPGVKVTRKATVPKHPVTNELMISGLSIPTRAHIQLSNKTFKLRPADRGYDKNAPVFGGLSLRGKKGGSVAGALLFDTARPGKRNRSWRPDGKEITVVGHKLPVRAQVGLPTMPRARKENARAMTREDRERLAFQYAPRWSSTEEKVFRARQRKDLRAIFGDDPKMMDLLNDPKKMAGLTKKYGSAEEKRQIDGREAARAEWRRAETAAQDTKRSRREGADAAKHRKEMEGMEAFIEALPNRPGTLRPLSGSGKLVLQARRVEQRGLIPSNTGNTATVDEASARKRVQTAQDKARKAWATDVARGRVPSGEFKPSRAGTVGAGRDAAAVRAARARRSEKTVYETAFVSGIPDQPKAQKQLFGTAKYEKRPRKKK